MGVSTALGGALAAFHFLHPQWLLALVPLGLMCAWGLTHARRQGAWTSLVDADLLPLLRMAEGGRTQSPWVLLGLAWTLAVLALAGPAWRQEESRAFKVPASWVVVLDLSPSMSAQDQPPDRATRARYAITDLLSAAHDARVALVVYAGEPHTVTPLTDDVATVRVLLRPLSPSLMPESGNRMAPALDEAGELLGQTQGGSRQVIVLADGSADMAEALTAAHDLRAQGITVNVVGVGTESGAPAPAGRGGFARDASGGLTMTRMESSELRDIARAGGGLFVPLAQLRELTEALQARQRGPLDAGERTSTHLGRWRNEGVWLLPPLLLLAALLARRGWV